jgi:TolA-binding protein
MKKFVIAEICVLLALAGGFWLGRVTGDNTSYEDYYDNADKAWTVVKQLDSPPVDLDSPDKSRLRKVRAAYREVFENYPDSLWADDAIYQLASRLPRTDEEAFALFRRLINNYPDSEWVDDSMYAIAFASYQIADQLKKTGTLESVDAYYDRALSLYNQLTMIYPGSELSDQAEFNKAMCYYGKGELNLALAQFDALREPFSDSPLLYQILYVTGEIYLKRQDYENARVEFTNVVDSGDPDLAPLASFGIPQSHLAEGNYQEAIDGYQKVIDLYPNSKVGQDAYFYMGWAYERLGKYDEAIARLEEAIDLYPHNENAANSQIYIGQIAYANNDMASAVDAYQKVADNSGYDYDTRRAAQYSVGKIYEAGGDTDLAVDAYQKLITGFPEPHKEATHPSNNINENYIQNLRRVGL